MFGRKWYQANQSDILGGQHGISFWVDDLETKTVVVSFLLSALTGVFQIIVGSIAVNRFLHTKTSKEKLNALLLAWAENALWVLILVFLVFWGQNCPRDDCGFSDVLEWEEKKLTEFPDVYLKKTTVLSNGNISHWETCVLVTVTQPCICMHISFNLSQNPRQLSPR